MLSQLMEQPHWARKLGVMMEDIWLIRFRELGLIGLKFILETQPPTRLLNMMYFNG